MYTSKKMKQCANFKLVEQQPSVPYKRINEHNCKDCVYFSSRNCGMDIADSIEPCMDIFC